MGAPSDAEAYGKDALFLLFKISFKIGLGTFYLWDFWNVNGMVECVREGRVA